MDHTNLGNGLDHEPAASSALAGNRSAEITVVATEPAAALIASRAVKGLIEPPIEDVTVRHFCVMTGDGRRGIAEWAEFAWRAANRGSGTDGDARQRRVRHAREMLNRVRADLRAADLIEIGMSPDQAGTSRDSHLRLMLWLSYGCIGLGFFVLNWTLSSYLLGSGVLDYADHPWKTYAFSSLPITAAFTLKATAALFTETQRRSFAVALGLTGGVVATLAWSASFAWLFGPQPVAAMTLPGDGMTADQWIGKALVFTHILGETCCAAALGFGPKNCG
jgi:hypothetical protein